MPQTKTFYQADFIWAIWQITETRDFLFSEFPKEYLEDSFFKKNSEQHQKEYLASRLLIINLLEIWQEDFDGIIKDKFGKPQLKGLPFSVSISHSQDYAVAILHRKKSIGIDIERIDKRLTKVIPRLFTQEEQEFGLTLENKCTLWCAKEAMYKWHGKRELDFKKHIQVNSWEPFKGEILQENFKQELDLFQYQMADYQIVYCF
jgi:phosphopantetheinyl transferase